MAFGPLYQLVFLLSVLIIAASIGIVVVRRSQRGIWVTGIDAAAGTVERRRFNKTNKHGGLTWKKRNGQNCHIVMAGSFSYAGRKGPEFIVNVSSDQGRVVRVDTDQKTHGMTGERLWLHLFGGALKDIAEASRTDIQGALKLLIIGAFVLLTVMLIGLGWIIKTLNSSGAA